MIQLSAHKRNEYIESATNEKFDLIIIGGGITGAGIALDASSRGMKVLLLEKYDFASGTSSKSTKLIHGGLRYLKQLEFGLVRQVGIERAIIHQLAPHLVTPVNMLLPIYKKGSLGRFATSIALRVYDFLAKVKKEDRYKMLGIQSIKQLEPLLRTDGLIGGAFYKEYRTDDARLTIEILKTASSFNAVCINYAKVEGFTYQDNLIDGVIFRDLLNNKQFTAKASVIINAAGPWVDDVRNLDEEQEHKKLFITKGVHLVVDHQRFPIQHAIYFDVADNKRMIFAIPRDKKVYIGTTDTAYHSDKDQIAADSDDVNYLLDAVNHLFPSIQLKHQDIESWWAGLRPLIMKKGRSPSELSRRDEIFISSKGLISIAGGKLTGYRKMAEKVTDIAANKIRDKCGASFKKCSTQTIKLNGSDFGIDIEEYIVRRAGEAKQIGITPADIYYLVHTYGTDTEKIIERAFELHETIHDDRKRLITAELQFCIEHEMVTNLSDYFIRRTGMIYFDKLKVEENKLIAAEIIKQAFHYTEAEVDQQLEFLREAMQPVTAP